ncbi:MAG: acetyl-CoA hydrolase, partial [Arenimonas sp.]|nr:acetyl-CoA hydrolase [Arenimonas sp.]
RNGRAEIVQRLAGPRASGVLPDYPMGSDFTAVEQRLVRALAWLKVNARGAGAARVLVRSWFSGSPRDEDAMARMQLQAPAGWTSRLLARLLSVALAQTRDSRV